MQVVSLLRAFHRVGNAGRYWAWHCADGDPIPAGGDNMNWLAEYFAQRTGPLTLGLWAFPPLRVGPEGPTAPPAYVLSYPGVQLTFTPPEVITHGKFRYELPAHYDSEEPLIASASDALLDDQSRQFFRKVSIYAPSGFNPDFLVTINDAYSFVPAFSSDGSPGFSGSCMSPLDEPQHPSQLKLPWTFQGFITI
jgi:hypothetical protein